LELEYIHKSTKTNVILSNIFGERCFVDFSEKMKDV